MTMITILTIAVSAKAMSYEQARREALFLTDKMAYELNLNDRQYDAAYEINLDYLMSVASRDDLYGTYWTRRNTDFGHILLEWQWNAFCAATYFYRPLYWNAGYWHFGIYARYPRRDYFYFARPTVYVSYRGGHSWRNNGGRSYYHGIRHEFKHKGASHHGMRDRWNNGEFSHGHNRRPGISSTHVTVNNDRKHGKGSGLSHNGTTADRGKNPSGRDNNRFGGSRGTKPADGTTHTGITSGRFGTSRPEMRKNPTLSTETRRPAETKSGISAATTRPSVTTARPSVTPARPSVTPTRRSENSIRQNNHGKSGNTQQQNRFGGRR